MKQLKLLMNTIKTYKLRFGYNLLRVEERNIKKKPRKTIKIRMEEKRLKKRETWLTFWAVISVLSFLEN